MKAIITFRTKLEVSGENMEEIVQKFSVLDLYSEEARKKNGIEFVEVNSVEEPDTFKDLKPEFNKFF